MGDAILATRNAREQIMVAARELFAQKGYRATTLRAVATRAHVDVALVPYYFKNKDGLFAAVLDIPLEPLAGIKVVMEASDEVGTGIARAMVDLIDNPGTNATLLALIQSVMNHDQGADLLREFIDGAVIQAFRGYLPEVDLENRVSLVVSHTIGLAMMRHLVRQEPLASMTRDELVEYLAPAYERMLLGEAVQV